MNLEEKLSEHVTLKEAIKSQTASRLGIDNSPTPEHKENIKKLLANIYEPLRKHFGGFAILIVSLYRSLLLNNATPGSSKTSFHCRGMAMDLDDVLGHVSNKEMFLYILKNLEFAELIWEFGDDNNPDWVHVAWCEGKNVKEVLRTKIVNGKTTYVKFDINSINLN